MKCRKSKFYATTKGGTLHFANPEQFIAWQSKLPDGLDLEITIEPVGEDPTRSQWAYLYSCVYEVFAEHFGWTIDDVDEYMKREFQKAYLIQLPKGLSLCKSSFDKRWLSTYINFCIMLAAREGVVVQEPDPEWRFNERRKHD